MELFDRIRVPNNCLSTDRVTRSAGLGDYAASWKVTWTKSKLYALRTPTLNTRIWLDHAQEKKF